MTIIITPIGEAHQVARFESGQVYAKHYTDQTKPAYRPAQSAMTPEGRGYFWRLWDADQIQPATAADGHAGQIPAQKEE